VPALRTPRDWHRHDDTSPPSINGHNSHGAILGEDIECPYRCLGYDVTADGPPPRRQACDCPDFVALVRSAQNDTDQ